MQNKRLLLINVVLALLIAFMVQNLSESGFLRRIELLGRDILSKLKIKHTYDPHIIIIEISDDDIARAGIWPWNRIWHAAIIKALSDMGTRQIYFDLIFCDNYSEEGDNLFGEAIKNAKNVYLPFAFRGESIDIKDTLMPLEKFYSYAKETGSINIYPDVDGNIRKIPLFFKYKGGVAYHIALKIAMGYSGLRIDEILPAYISLSGRQGGIKIPLIEENSMLLNWAGKWKDTFKHYSFLDVLAAYQDYLENRKPEIDITPFKDSICLISVTAVGLCDIKSIPIEQIYPGVGVIATAVNNILERNFIILPPSWIKILLIYILALTAPILIFAISEKRIFLLKVLFLSAAIVLISCHFFNKDLILDITSPLIAFLSAFFTTGAVSFFYIKAYFSKLANTDGLTGLFNIRYFRMMLRAEYLAAKADSKNKFCVIMTDVDDFKHFNDTYGHVVGDLILKETAKILKTHLSPRDVAARYGGEEMIIFIKNASLETGKGIAEEIRKKIESLAIKGEKKSYKITVSLGVSAFDSNDENEDSVIKRSDIALYHAKEMGKNCTMSFCG